MLILRRHATPASAPYDIFAACYAADIFHDALMLRAPYALFVMLAATPLLPIRHLR